MQRIKEMIDWVIIFLENNILHEQNIARILMKMNETV